MEMVMIHAKDHKTGYLFDPWDYLGPKRRKLIDESWAGLFRKHILNELPVDKLARFFTEGFGRPTKELYTVLGVLLLQQTHDLTDEETIAQLSFNLQWHYALDIMGESDEVKYMSPKTLWSMRNMMMEKGIDADMFRQSTDKLAKVFDVDTSRQRLDSVHIYSNMKRLGRIGIFVRSIHKFLVNLKRQHGDLMDTLPKEVVDRYLPEKGLVCFSMVKPSEAERTLGIVSKDLFDLTRCFHDHPEVMSMSSFLLLLRVLKEQCSVSQTLEGMPVEVGVKPAREVSSDSLQNPTDPDATYDGHKGQGYQVQVMETYLDTKDQEIREKTLNLITHVDLETACKSDCHALIPAIESTSARGLGPDEVLADSLYGHDENCEVAKEMEVAVVSPVMGTLKEGSIGLSEFSLSDMGVVIACPEGHTPVWTKNKEKKHTAAFEPARCSACPLKATCPVKDGKKYRYLRYKDKEWRIAIRRAKEHTDEFKEKYRWRSGIEATMSEYAKKTGVKRLRVRGFLAVRVCVTLKAIGINIFRATAVRKAIRAQGGNSGIEKSVLGLVIFVLKKLYGKIHRRVEQIFSSQAHYNYFELKTVA